MLGINDKKGNLYLFNYIRNSENTYFEKFY